MNDFYKCQVVPYFESTIPDIWSEDDVNPICGCHRRLKCLGCGACTNCDGCYCQED